MSRPTDRPARARIGARTGAVAAAAVAVSALLLGAGAALWSGAASAQPVATPGAGDARPRAPWSGLGRPATPAEIRAWDIDVRPDFKGLPTRNPAAGP